MSSALLIRLPIYVRVPNAAIAETFSREVSRLSRSATFYGDACQPPPAFGWLVRLAGLSPATYIEVDPAQRLLVHPSADASKLRRIVNDMTARELGACLTGQRGTAKRMDPDTLLPPFLTQHYIDQHRGGTIPASDFFAPFMLNAATTSRDALEPCRHFPETTTEAA